MSTSLKGFFADPTLAAVDRALEAEHRAQKRRSYLGFSIVGDECERRLWYEVQHNIHKSVPKEPFTATGIRAVQDGFVGEDIMADRLRKVDGVELHTHDDKGRQFGFKDLGGRFSGHMDGAIRGLIQSPATWHVWEHKQVNEKKFNSLNKLRAEDEKSALRQWDSVYYAQAVLYMYYSGMTRHYLTCCTPGGRDYTSVRTEANNKYARKLRERAERVLIATTPPLRVSDNPSYYKCKWCPFRETCHKQTERKEECQNQNQGKQQSQLSLSPVKTSRPPSRRPTNS